MAGLFKKFLKEVEKFTQPEENKNEHLTPEEELHHQPASEADEEEEEEYEVEFDPKTLHGTHYTEEDFEATVKQLSEEWIAKERASGEQLSQEEIDNIYWNYRRDLYTQWNNATNDEVMRWQAKNSLKHRGVAMTGADIDETDNSLLEPVHGISLKDYGAICAAMANGYNEEKVLKAFGIDKAIFDELNVIWPKRMAEDGSFSISTLFGQYFGEGPSHPKLQDTANAAPSTNTDNLEKFKTDRYFFEELNGARQAAYDYGIDGAKWIEENFGISLGDFQAVTMRWHSGENLNWNTERIKHFFDYRDQKQNEYAEKFAKEMGGNVADDVEF